MTNSNDQGCSLSVAKGATFSIRGFGFVPQDDTFLVDTGIVTVGRYLCCYLGFNIPTGRIISSVDMPPCWNVYLNSLSYSVGFVGYIK